MRDPSNSVNVGNAYMDAKKKISYSRSHQTPWQSATLCPTNMTNDIQNKTDRHIFFQNHQKVVNNTTSNLYTSSTKTNACYINE